MRKAIGLILIISFLTTSMLWPASALADDDRYIIAHGLPVWINSRIAGFGVWKYLESNNLLLSHPGFMYHSLWGQAVRHTPYAYQQGFTGWNLWSPRRN